MSVDAGFRHEALLYAGTDEFVAEAECFLTDAIEANEPVLVAVSPEKVELLTDRLDGSSDCVQFVDMLELGHNPACLIPEWQRFLDRHSDSRQLRGIGEPVWPERRASELVECHRHEALLNLAVPKERPFWLLCPYDTAALDPSILAEAGRTHPHILEQGVSHESRRFTGAIPTEDVDPLPEPSEADVMPFDGDLAALRRFVRDRALQTGMPPHRVDDLTLAADELAANSVRYGGGSGTLRLWTDGDRLVCEVRDAGRISDPLAGRRIPGPDPQESRGLWLVNHLCDLVQIRSRANGSIVRIHMDIAPTSR